jgi:hypothetical protein
MLVKKIEEKFEKFVNLFVNVCILNYRTSFGVLVYDTSIWFFSPF